MKSLSKSVKSFNLLIKTVFLVVFITQSVIKVSANNKISESPVAVNDAVTDVVTNTEAKINAVSNDTDADGNETIDVKTLNIVTVGATDTDSDNDNDRLEVTGEGVWTVNNDTGEVTFTPELGFTGDPTLITYNIKDNDGNLSNNAIITVDYAIQNPTAVNDEVTEVVTKTEAKINALSNDADPDGSINPKTLNIVTAGATDTDSDNDNDRLEVTGEGVWTVNNDTGEVTFTPEIGFTNDPTLITYNIKDNDGNLSNNATISVDYAVQNPVAVNDEVTGAVTNTPAEVDVPANDTDADGTINLTTVNLIEHINATNVIKDADNEVIGFTMPNQGVWAVNETNGKVTFTPDSGFTSDPTPISYNIKDNDGNISNNAQITVDYGAQNPVAVNDSVEGVLVNTPAIVDADANDTDADGSINPSTLNIVTSGATDTDNDNDNDRLEITNEGIWTVNNTNGDVTFTPDSGFTGDPTAIIYNIKDNDGNVSNNATITVNYKGKNPIAVNDEVTNAKTNEPVIIDADANDTDADGTINPQTLNITTPGATDSDNDDDNDTLVITGEGAWTVNNNTAEVTFTPQTGFTGDPKSITYTIKDNDGDTSNSATITIDYAIESPVAENDAVTGAETNNPVIIDVDANDTDPDGTIDPTTVNILTDGATDSDNDNDNDTLVVTGEGTWTVNNNSAEVTFTPQAGFTNDPTLITYNIKDNDGNVSNNATVTVDYGAQNPVAVDDTLSDVVTKRPAIVNVLANDTDADGTINKATVNIVSTSATDSDNDGDNDVLVVSKQGVWQVNNTSGEVTFTPEEGFTSDPEKIIYNIKDNDGNISNNAIITVDYAGQNPIAVNDVITNAETNTSVVIDVDANDTDADGTINPQTVNIVTAGATDSDNDSDNDTLVVDGQGTWTVNNDTAEVTFTPQEGFTNDPTLITYTIKDNDGNVSNKATVTIDYAAQNPVAENDVLTGIKTTTPATINVITNDADADGAIDAKTVNIVSPLATDTDTDGDNDTLVVTGEGTWTVNNTTAEVNFTPQEGFTGNPTVISYNVKDNDGNLSNDAIISITYNPQNPVAKNDLKAELKIGVVATLNVIANNGNGEDTDTDGTINPATVNLIVPITATNVIKDAAGEVISFEVPTQGSWVANETTADVTFTPLPTMLISPTPIKYTIKDNDGNESNEATITFKYLVQDTDGDGVPDQVEIDKGTNPQDECDYNVVDVTEPITATKDCDNDGIIDKDEINGPDGDPKTDDGSDPKKPDTDGDGVLDGTEVAKGTKAKDECDYNVADITVEITAITDCDNDGIVDKDEINGPDGDPSTPDGSDPKKPDTDGDGALDGIEVSNGTKANDACDYNIADITIEITAAKDCDNDGLIDKDEINGPDGDPSTPDGSDPKKPDTDGDGVLDGKEVTNGTNTKDECDYNIVDISEPITATKDCDNDGIIDKDEIYGPDDDPKTPDGTDPKKSDTDGDGINDGKEVADGSDPNDPCDPIECVGDTGTIAITSASKPGNTLTITLDDKDLDINPSSAETFSVQTINEVTNEIEIVLLTENAPNSGVFVGTVKTIFGVTAGTNNDGTFNAKPEDTIKVTYDDEKGNTGNNPDPISAVCIIVEGIDTDGDGVLDGVEISNGTKPDDECDYNVADITETITATKDCDNDGIIDKDEVNGPDGDPKTPDGTNPKDPDTDKDGVLDGTEITKGTSPLDECDYNIADITLPISGIKDCDNDGVSDRDEIYGPDGDPSTPDGSNPKKPDTDGDGVLDGKELESNTITYNECDYNVADITVEITATKDCDNDGIIDKDEINGPDGDPSTPDGTDPKKPDTDGDGVLDGTELANGTKPKDECNYNVADITVEITAAKDCDNDGLTDKDEINGPDGDPNTDDGSDPKKPDTDGDGVIDGKEVIKGTNTKDECDYNVADVSVEITATTDCDNDGIIDKDEINGSDGDPNTPDGTDPKKADTDDDGINDGDEINGGSDPNDPCSPNECVGDTGTITITEYSSPGDELTITLEDTDLNVDAETAEKITVEAVNEVTNEIEAIELTETGVDTGIFVGTVKTVKGDVAGTNNDGTFNTKSKDKITVTYDDEKGNQGNDPDPVSDTNIVVEDVDGDGDGVLDDVEVLNGTKPDDPCDYNVADITTEITADKDCDFDGIIDKDEINGPDGDPKTDDGTDPKNPDTDADGVLDGTEIKNTTNPNDECSYNVADITEPIISVKDCDNDGIPDIDEILGPDGDPKTDDTTNPFEPDTDGDGVLDGKEVSSGTIGNDECDYKVIDITIPITATKDCDNDGINDDKEIEGPDGTPKTGDETDPLNPDTDGDGINDGDEIKNGSNPNDPCDPKACTGNTGTIDITDISSPGDILTITLIDKDLNTSSSQTETFSIETVNEVTNETETVLLTETNVDSGVFLGTVKTIAGATGGTNNDGTFNTKPGDTIKVTYDDAKGNQSEDPDPVSDINRVFAPGDKDGDGVLDSVEIVRGTDQNDACDYNIADISEPITADKDCDNDGIIDKDEINGPDGDPNTDDGTNPIDPDSDDDGVLDGKEIKNNTNPNGECDYNVTDVDPDLIINPSKDCDKDGISDADEIVGADGLPNTKDETNPFDPDTDGDGVSDGSELNLGTNPVNSCSYSIDAINLEITADRDCDGDGIIDKDEIFGSNPTDPKNPDSDDDGLTDGDEVLIHKTDPNDSDTDDDGVTDNVEITTSKTNPNAPCDYKQEDRMPGFEPTIKCGDRTQVYNVVTPNDDGDNDVWFIKHLEEYPDNTVKIYNRWGVLVFETVDYGKNDNFFKGVSEGRTTLQEKEELPAGTYYYIIEFVNDENVVTSKTGYLYLQR